MILTTLIRAFRRWRSYEVSVRELSRLGDRELQDIGITRSDITRVAWDAARA